MHCNFSQLPKRKLERDGWYPCWQCGGGIPVGNLPQFCKQGSTSFAPGSMLILVRFPDCLKVTAGWVGEPDYVNSHSLKKLCMLYSHLWKKKKFRPKYWKQLKCNACAQEVVWDPKDPDEGAGDGASSNHRFFAPISSGKNQAILEGCWSRLRYWCQRRRRGRWPLLRWKASASTKPRWTGWWWCSTDIFVSQN